MKLKYAEQNCLILKELTACFFRYTKYIAMHVLTYLFLEQKNILTNS